MFSEKPHRIVINSRTAKKINWLSYLNKEEKEVLFSAPTDFKVGVIRELPDGMLEIMLDELI